MLSKKIAALLCSAIALLSGSACTQQSTQESENALPVTMEVDYVRVFQKK